MVVKRITAYVSPKQSHCVNVARVLSVLSIMMHTTLYAFLSECREWWIIARSVSCSRYGTYASHIQTSHHASIKQ